MIHPLKPEAYFTHANHDKLYSLRPRSPLPSSSSRNVHHWFDGTALIKSDNKNGTQTDSSKNGQDKWNRKKLQTYFSHLAGGKLKCSDSVALFSTVFSTKHLLSRTPSKSSILTTSITLLLCTRASSPILIYYRIIKCSWILVTWNSLMQNHSLFETDFCCLNTAVNY